MSLSPRLGPEAAPHCLSRARARSQARRDICLGPWRRTIQPSWTLPSKGAWRPPSLRRPSVDSRRAENGHTCCTGGLKLLCRPRVAPAALPSLLWVLPIPGAFFSPVCKDLGMELHSGPPHPPLPGGHGPPLWSGGERGWGAAVYTLLYPNCEAFGMGNPKGLLLTSPGGAGGSLAPCLCVPPPPPGLWELPGLVGLGGYFKASPKLVGKCHPPDLGLQVAPQSHCPVSLTWGGCWLTAPAPGVSPGGREEGEFCSFFWDQCLPPCRCPSRAACPCAPLIYPLPFLVCASNISSQKRKKQPFFFFLMFSLSGF